MILSLVVHRVRHNVPGVLANNCAFGDPYDCAESYSGVVWGGELRNVFFEFIGRLASRFLQKVFTQLEEA